MYDNNPHDQGERIRVYEDAVASAMVTLVHLYRNSIGGLIDQEARKILAKEFNDTETTRWKWMFAASGAIRGDTSAALSFEDAGSGVSANLTTAVPGLDNSSRYLLLKQVPASTTDNTCVIYSRDDHEQSQGHNIAMDGYTLQTGSSGALKVSYNADLTTPYQFGNGFVDDYTASTQNHGTDMTPRYKRLCSYQLVAGTPLTAMGRSAVPGFPARMREETYKAVSAPITHGAFNPLQSRAIGCEGVYDGIGTPGSSWFARARFKAFMHTVNK